MPFPFFPRQETAEPTTSPVISPEGDTATIERQDHDNDAKDGYRVLLYNDDHTPIDEVVEQIIKATQYSMPKVIQIVEEVERKGRAICYRGARSKCQQVTAVLREIRLQCEVDCD